MHPPWNHPAAGFAPKTSPATEIARLLALLSVLLWSAAAPAQKLEQFAATRLIFLEPGKAAQEERLFFGDGKLRVEAAAPVGKGVMVSIFRPDLKKQWLLNPQKQLYGELPIEGEEGGGPIVRERELGRETVAGFECVKTELLTTLEFSGGTPTVKTLVWRSERLALPLRTLEQDGSGSELRAVVERQHPPSLFEIPPGYRQAPDHFALWESFSTP